MSHTKRNNKFDKQLHDFDEYILIDNLKHSLDKNNQWIHNYGIDDVQEHTIKRTPYDIENNIKSTSLYETPLIVVVAVIQ